MTAHKTIETIERDGYTLEKRENKHRRTYWVAIVNGKVVGKGGSISLAAWPIHRARADAARKASGEDRSKSLPIRLRAWVICG